MARHLITSMVGWSDAQRLNAQSKARQDVCQTLADCGAQEIRLYAPKLWDWVPRKIFYTLRALSLKVQATIKFRSIRPNDEVWIQYPDEGTFLIHAARRRGARCVVLIHDIISLRTPSYNWEREAKTLRAADRLFVHTEAMRDFLRERGIGGEMTTIHLFDYYTTSAPQTMEERVDRRHEVAFAGNLDKSAFLQRETHWAADGFQLRLYGRKPSTPARTAKTVYCHAFAPDSPSISGGWGLVWDGDSTTTCSGTMGAYLRYNSSHKNSLYLVCGLPLIVWSESALADFVKREGIGICVPSIEELDSAVCAVTEEEYRQMAARAEALGARLKTGGNLKGLI